MSDHISVAVTDSGLGGYMELIRCPICAAVLVDEEGEKAHLQWHEKMELRLRPLMIRHPNGRLEILSDDELNSHRLRYDADENTPFVDNAGTEKA